MLDPARRGVDTKQPINLEDSLTVSADRVLSTTG